MFRLTEHLYVFGKHKDVQSSQFDTSLEYSNSQCKHSYGDSFSN